MPLFDIIDQKVIYKYYACEAYYPNKYYSDTDLSEGEAKFRKIVWQFKDGKNSKAVAEALAEGISEIEEIINVEEWALCCIPASTRLKTEIRYKEFCNEFCRLTNIKNGYNYISNKNDHQAGHLGGARINANTDLKYEGVFKDSKILLFDDVITRGETFLQVAVQLKRIGAKQIIGMMLGKTTYKQTRLE